MAKNKMGDVAKLLELELREEFKIKGLSARYRFTNIGLQYKSETEGVWYTSNKLLPMLLQGEISIIKVEQPILDDVEKKYLSAVIKPFRDRIISIRKYKYNQDEYIGIYVKYYAETDESEMITLPLFKEGTIYKGIELKKYYTLEELGL